MDPHRPPKERGCPQLRARQPLKAPNQTFSSASVQQVRIFYNRLVSVRHALACWQWQELRLLVQSGRVERFTRAIERWL